MSDCGRATGMLPEFVDGELEAERYQWLAAHLQRCGACRAALAEVGAIDAGLRHRVGTSMQRAVARMREDLS